MINYKIQFVNQLNKTGISRRTINVILQNFSSFEDIIEYYNNNGTFQNLKNCGAKSSMEIEHLLNNIPNNSDNNDILENNLVLNKFESRSSIDLIKIEELKDHRYKDFIQEYFKIEMLNLDASSFRGLKENVLEIDLIQYLKNINTIGYYTKIRKIKNVGDKTIKKFREINNKLIENIILLMDESKSIEYRKYLIFRNFCINELGLAKEYININYKKQFLERELNLISFLEVVIKNLFLTDDTPKINNLIWENYFCVFGREKLDFRIIGEKCQFSHERVRQVKVKIEESFQTNLNKIIFFVENNVNYFNDKNLIILNKEFYNDIINYSKLSYEFVIKLFQKLIKSSNKLISLNKDNQVFISKNLYNHFKFNEFYNDIDSKLKNTKFNSFEMQFSDYLERFIIIETYDPNNKSINQLINKVCKDILLSNFRLVILENVIKIKKSPRTRKEYVYNILNKVNSPMHFDDIIKSLKLNYPDKEFNKQSIKSILNSEFALYGNSIFGLHSWETEQGLISGTIKDVVEFYLKKFEKPCRSIKEVSKFVKNHRDTTSHNIRANIIQDKDGRFEVIDDHILLKNKN